MAATRRKRPVNAAYLKKTPSEVHNGFAEYITSTTGEEVSAETVSLVQRLYPLYLKSPAVVRAKEAAAAAKAEEAARKKAEKDARLKERLAKIEEQRAKLLADLGIEGDLDGEKQGDVIDASTRFTDHGITFGEQAEEDDEDEDTEPEEDEDEVAEEATITDESDEDEWDDEDDDESEEDF